MNNFKLILINKSMNETNNVVQMKICFRIIWLILFKNFSEFEFDLFSDVRFTCFHSYVFQKFQTEKVIKVMSVRIKMSGKTWWTVHLQMNDFDIKEMNLLKSCGQSFCDGCHDIKKPCLDLNTTKRALPVFALQGILFIEDPMKIMSGVNVQFRSARIAKLFIHNNLLRKGPNIAGRLVNSTDIIQSADKVQQAYKNAGIFWNLEGYYKPGEKMFVHHSFFRFQFHICCTNVKMHQNFNSICQRL
jgi:hypothetical protein